VKGFDQPWSGVTPEGMIMSMAGELQGTGRLGRKRVVQTAEGQAAILFTAAGTLGLASNLLPEVHQTRGAITTNALALIVGLVVAALPWRHWHPRATLALVPVALGIISAGQVAADGASTPLFGLWFVVVFAWLGSWHPPRTSLVVAPLAVAAYVAPFLPSQPTASSEALQTVAIAIPVAVVLGEVTAARTAAARRANLALEATTALLEQANLTDDLTGVGNRRCANALLDALRPDDGVVLLDLDHFKVVNDTRGHAAGDEILQQLGEHLRRAARTGDTPARFGGEEFLLVVRGADGDLRAIVERLLAGWRQLDTGVTMSAGAAVHSAGRAPHETFAAADALLYAAKAAGRDQLMVEDEVRLEPVPVRVQGAAPPDAPPPGAAPVAG
jgi:diguanylate cyclase